MAKTVVELQKPNAIGFPSPEFIKSDFDDSVWNKGYAVIHEKMIKCPCKSKDGQPLATCQNCQGTGWVVIDATSTRMLLQSMNSNTKYRAWSSENLGTVSVTAMERDKLSFMDKITVEDSESIMTEVLYTKTYLTNSFLYTVYDIKEIITIYRYIAADQPLLRLIEGTHYTIERNKILLINTFDWTDAQVSVRYKHKVVYGIVDLNHDVRTSNTHVNGIEESSRFPVSGVGRRFHYLIDSLNFNGDNLIDNSLIQ